MSRHRVKAISYDDDDVDGDYDEDDYCESEEDAEAQKQLEIDTNEVIQRLLSGSPSVASITKAEVQESLWHYYNDVEKSVNYLRSKKIKEIQKQQLAVAGKSKSSTVHRHSLPSVSPQLSLSGHFSTADFFRDSPWLNVPANRKAEIIIEPLYPSLGLLGGAPQTDGKVSKLAALAAARKKKGNGNGLGAIVASTDIKDTSSLAVNSKENGATPMSLQERLSAPRKDTNPPGHPSSGLAALKKDNNTRTEIGTKSTYIGRPSNTSPALEKIEHTGSSITSVASIKSPTSEPIPIPTSLRATPSTFASAIIGDTSNPSCSNELVHSWRTSLDIMTVYGQDFTEAFDFSGPSPDDIVLNAQSASKGLKSKQNASKAPIGKKAQAGVTSAVKALSIEEPVHVKSKNLDVLSEYSKSQKKNSANFVVIGHVDAGKSTLMGRLLADLNAVDQRTLDRYKREAEKIGKGSFALAWVLDQGSEERARGVTIDIATNKFETEKTRFTILDAPGHRDFVPNMIAGASQADFAVLVIDASTGNFESGLKGQTKEHALLVRSIGVQKIVVAINKMDTVQWSKDRFEEIKQQISGFLTMAGFQAKNISFVPCSGIHGDNITRRTKDPNALWYTGRTLIEDLETSEKYNRALDKPLRITIGDVFRGGVQNPLSISGRIDAGSLQVGDTLLTMPSGETAVIRSLEVDGEPKDWAVAGQNIVLHLTNIDPIHLRSGDVVCNSSAPIQNVRSFMAKVLAFDHLMPMQVDIHRGRLHASGRISKLVAILDKGSGTVVKRKPKIVPPGGVARIVVEMEQQVPLEAPTRIVLRASGETVAAGLIE